MAHDHRMQPVGEPHLNARNRKVVEGRNTDLYNLKNMLVGQLNAEWTEAAGDTVFVPDFEPAVQARLSNYRAMRDLKQSAGQPLTEFDKSTRDEISRRFKSRHNYKY